jgi:hypothetical protein
LKSSELGNVVNSDGFVLVIFMRSQTTTSELVVEEFIFSFFISEYGGMFWVFYVASWSLVSWVGNLRGSPYL